MVDKYTVINAGTSGRLVYGDVLEAKHGGYYGSRLGSFYSVKSLDRLSVSIIPSEEFTYGVTKGNLQTPPCPPDNSNPKAAFGDKKVPLFLVPVTFIAGVALALFEGASKYGKWNWRRSKVESSTYVHATGRHLLKYYHGEDCDPTTKIKHLYNAAASLCILIDAEVAGTLIDDRPPKVDVTDQFQYIENTLAHLKELFKDHKPTHHTEKA